MCGIINLSLPCLCWIKVQTQVSGWSFFFNIIIQYSPRSMHKRATHRVNGAAAQQTETLRTCKLTQSAHCERPYHARPTPTIPTRKRKANLKMKAREKKKIGNTTKSWPLQTSTQARPDIFQDFFFKVMWKVHAVSRRKPPFRWLLKEEGWKVKEG